MNFLVLRIQQMVSMRHHNNFSSFNSSNLFGIILKNSRIKLYKNGDHTDNIAANADIITAHADKTSMQTDKTCIHADKTRMQPDKTRMHADKTRMHADNISAGNSLNKKIFDKITMHADKTAMHSDKIRMRLNITSDCVIKTLTKLL